MDHHVFPRFIKELTTDFPKLRLDIICLQSCFHFKYGKVLTRDSNSGRIIWKMANRIIPREFGVIGVEALRLLRMLAYLSEEKEMIQIINIHFKKVFDNMASVLQILVTYNLIKFHLPRRDGTYNPYQHYLREVNFTLENQVIIMKTIRDENLTKEFEILEDCLTRFVMDKLNPQQYCAVWNAALKYDKLFRRYFNASSFAYHITDEMNLKYPGLLNSALANSEKCQEWRSVTILAATEAIFILKADTSSDSAKWKRFEEKFQKYFDYGIRCHFQIIADNQYKAGMSLDKNSDVRIKCLRDSLIISSVLIKKEPYLVTEGRFIEQMLQCVLEQPVNKEVITKYIKSSCSALKNHFHDESPHRIFGSRTGFIPVWISIIDKIIQLVNHDLEFTKNSKMRVSARKSVLKELLRLLKQLYQMLESDFQWGRGNSLFPHIVLLRLNCLKLLGDQRGVCRTIKKTCKMRYLLEDPEKINLSDNERQEVKNWNDRVDNFHCCK